jgi:hypothetical protein
MSHADAISFSRILRERAFQQPRDLSPTISRGRVNFVPIFTMAVRTSIMTASRDNENDLHKTVKLNF